MLTQNLRVTAGGAYNWTRIDDPNLSVGICRTCTVTDPINAAGRAVIDGNDLPQAAKWMANATLRYGIPMGNDGELFFYTDWSYRSEVNFFLYDSRNSPASRWSKVAPRSATTGARVRTSCRCSAATAPTRSA